MANKRMFCKDIVGSDAFQDMPASSQLLYFHLGMEADDDGFIGNPKKIARSIGMADDDMKILVAKRFVLIFPSGVLVIKHHRINNNWDKHNCKRTRYVEEFNQLLIKGNGAYTRDKTQGRPIQSVFSLESDCNQTLEEKRIEEKRIDNNTSELSSQVKQVMDIFYKINPTLNWGNKTIRKSCEFLIGKFGLEETIRISEAAAAAQGQPYAPTINNPYHLKEKLASLKNFYDRQKNNKPKIATIL